MAAWPTFACDDKAAEAEIGSLMRLVTEIRRFRSDQGLRPGQRVPARLAGIAATPLAGHEASIRVAAAADRLRSDGVHRLSASLSAEGVTVELDLAGTVDVAAERKRLEKDLADRPQGGAAMAAKLGNGAFTAKAPADVIGQVARSARPTPKPTSTTPGGPTSRRCTPDGNRSKRDRLRAVG